MDRLSTLDAEFLHLEDSVEHLHIAGACVFGGEPPSIDELEAQVASKLHLIPRYRQRVRTVPFELGRPVWVDDPHFDLHYHVRHTALPEPGDDDVFNRFMGRIMSGALDRKRPLWEAWLVEGLSDDRWCIVFKVHHCMVDGVSGVELLTALLDLEPVTEIGEPEPWEPAREPAVVSKLFNAWGGLARDARVTVGDMTDAVLNPLDAAWSLLGTAQGAARMGADMWPKPKLSIEGPIGPHRSYADSSASLAEVKAVGHEFGATVNDVVLAALAGAYRELLSSRGDDPDSAEVRSLVPVSTRHDDELGIPDNRVSALFYDLPVHLNDPLERLASVSEQMAEVKESHMAEAGEAILSVGDLVPPMLIGPLSRLAARTLRRVSQHSINTVTTNVPGPQFPLFALGHEMLEYRPFVPIFHGIRVATAILSYNGQLFFGITGDYTTASDVDVVANGASAGVSELFELVS